jgi:hypothetical protein
VNRRRGRKPPLAEIESQDPVEQAGLDSFPASDPPAWVPLHIGRPSTSAMPDSSGKPGSEEAVGRDEGGAAHDRPRNQGASDPASTERAHREPTSR